MRRFPPERIVCLTEETVETLYMLEEDHRIVGVTGYAVRPARVRKEKPRIGAYLSARLDRILELEPDLVLSFSDLQADIVADLLRAGVTVMSYNQRDIAGILAMIRHLGATIGAGDRAEALAAELEARLARVAAESDGRPRPKVYFEEWDDPMISGIGWVSELIGIAGGEDIFPALAGEAAAKDRIVSDAQVIAARPDIIVASWCGKKVRPEKIAAREGWADLPAVRAGRIASVPSPIILQPGPAALTEGLEALRRIIGQG